MVHSYPPHTKSDNSALFISCSPCYYTARWTVPTFLSTSWMLQSTGLHHTVDRTMYHCKSDLFTYKTQIMQVVLLKNVYLLLLW